MNWVHFNPVAIRAGADFQSRLNGLLAGKRILLVTTRGLIRRKTAELLTSAVSPAEWVVRPVAPNPDLDELDRTAGELKGLAIEAVVALGGGSAMDSAKALAAALAAKPAWSLATHLRESPGRPLEAALPLVCLPTTAGTGAEVTPFATLWDRARGLKRSLDDPLLFARAAFLVPELTWTLPWTETLWGGLDTLSHSLETLWNRKSTVISRALARQAAALVRENLPGLEGNPENPGAREALQQAAALAGLAISQNRTALAHAFSYPLTLAYGVPHGLACSFTLPALADLVESRGAWAEAQDRSTGLETAAFIRGLHLERRLGEYCSLGQALALGDRMFTPGRADNFAVPVTAELAAGIISLGFRGAPRPESEDA